RLMLPVTVPLKLPLPLISDSGKLVTVPPLLVTVPPMVGALLMASIDVVEFDVRTMLLISKVAPAATETPRAAPLFIAKPEPNLTVPPSTWMPALDWFQAVVCRTTVPGPLK